MWRKYSLIYPATLFILLAIGATMVVGYTINYAILEDVLHERMSSQAQQVGGDVLQALDNKIQKLERFKNSWLGNTSWGLDEALNPGLVTHHQPEKRPDALWAQLKELSPLWGVEFMLLLNSTGQITHHMPENLATSQPLSPTLLQQVYTQTTQNQAVWHIAKVAGSWQIMLFAPINIDPQEKTHVIVFGQGLQKIVTQLQHENPNRPFLIAAIDGIAAGSQEKLLGAHFQLSAAAATILENSARMVFDQGAPANLYYAPIPFLDQIFALAVPVTLDSVRHTLVNSRQRLMVSIVFIIILLVILGIGMERLLLRPLRKLREKAAIMVKACSSDEHALYLNPDEQGNEIILLERAMEEASIKLYTHVAHLVDTKRLLEGLALKDPITQLGNRRMLDEFLTSTLGSCKRKKRQVAVILLELEAQEAHPEQLNTEAYNQILFEMASRLNKQLRGEDLAFRIQHNEFVAFAPECGDEEQLLALVYRLHRLLTQPYRLTGSRNIRIQIHMGVAVFPGAGEDADTLLANARSALEKAHSGIHYDFAIYNFPEATEEPNLAG